MDEQIDKNTGAQTSAQALTWSYANVRIVIITVFNSIIIIMINMTFVLSSNKRTGATPM